MNTRNMNRTERRVAARRLDKESAAYPAHLVEITFAHLDTPPPPGLVTVWRSCDYLVQVFFAAAPALARLSVNRTALAGKSWKADIPWEDLQRLKLECGWGDKDAVEVFPKQRDIVNVANMRHLWIMADPLDFAWRKPT